MRAPRTTSAAAAIKCCARRNPIPDVIGGINERLVRLEDRIGELTSSILQFLALEEKVRAEDYIYIYSRTINSSFMIGTGIIGKTDIGDRRGPNVLVAEGTGK